MANDNKVSEILKDIVGELKDIARSQTVVGNPITVKDKTVIPVVKISVGFGAGGGQGEAKEKGAGFGGGGGGAAKIEPAAFIIMDEHKISLLSAKPGKLDALVEAVPELIGKIRDVRDKMKKDKPAESSPEGNPGDENPGY
nr:sporulation protein [candidate division Zixibacteria bacterium]